jgi:hypothetical protein
VTGYPTDQAGDYPTTTPAAIPLRDAAAHLGISENAVRKRITRGTLQAHKVDGAWRVVVDGYPAATPEPAADQAAATPSNQPPAMDQTALVEQLQREVERLWEEIEARRESERDLRRLLDQEQQLALQRLTLQAGQARTGSTERDDQHEDEDRSGRVWWKFWER